MAEHSQVLYFNEAVEKQLGFAAAVQTGRTLYLSGVVAIDDKMQVVGAGDMAAQVTRVYDLLEIILNRAGASLRHVVSESIYVTDIAALAAAADVRAKRFADCAPPCSTVVQVSALFFPEAMIEVQVTAYLSVDPENAR